MITSDNFIFVSYSRKYEKIAKKLVKLLEKQHKVYFDQYAIKGGADWLKEIATKARECKVMLCLLTDNYQESSYCMFESDNAYGKPHICIRYGNVEPKGVFKDMIGNRQIVTLKDDSDDSIEKAYNEFYNGGIFFPCYNHFYAEVVEGKSYCEKEKRYSEKATRYYELFKLNECKKLTRDKITFKFDTSIAPNILDQFESNSQKDIKQEIEEKRKSAEEKSRKLGYTFDNNKLWLKSFILERPSTHQLKSLTMTFGNIKYYDHQALRGIVLSEQYYDKFMSPFTKSVNGDYQTCVWSMVGGGVWVVTKDNYLIVSKRTNKVLEKPDCYGYSAAGGFDGINQENEKPKDPFEAIADEILTELGVDIKNNLDELQLRSVGIDLERAIIQFSFFARINHTFAEVCELKEKSSERYELELEKMSFTKIDVAKLLLSEQAKTMEPGAIASLFNIYQNDNDFINETI